MSNILFLDFDGPLWSDRITEFHQDNLDLDHPRRGIIHDTMVLNGDTFIAQILTYWKMDDIAVGMLNTLAELYTFKTVVSSSWREICSRDTIECIFKQNNLNITLHSHWATDSHRDPSGVHGNVTDRLLQIKRWIDQYDVRNYVIVDDPESGGALNDPSMVAQYGLDPNNVIIVDPFIGLELKHYYRMRQILSRGN